jgi:tripartite-type tricarboxylate transporter receptor subunit TctC
MNDREGKSLAPASGRGKGAQAILPTRLDDRNSVFLPLDKNRIVPLTHDVTIRGEAMPRLLTFAAVIFGALVHSASAQDYPSRPITLIVPYAAGGPVDTLGRIMAARLSEVLGQQVVIENVGGAGGMTGAARAAKATPDGYTVLLSGSAVLAINQTLYKRPLYDGVNDFEHAVLFSDSARVLIARPDFPGSTLPEFVAYAKQNHAKMQYGSAGAGSGVHVCSILLNQAMAPRSPTCPIAAPGRRCRT